MKKIVSQLVILASFALISCNKHAADMVVTPLAGHQIDTALVRLARMDIANLPSPYYRFTYNDSGYVTAIQFAAGLFQYELQYENKRLKKMTNIVNGDFLAYTYRGGNVTDVDEYAAFTGERFGHYDLAYDASRRLIALDYARFDNNGQDSIAERRFEFTYHPSGNLAFYKSFWRDNAGVLTWTSTTGFDNFDNGINIDDFGLYKEFFDHFLYLPAVKLLRNNPRTSHIVGVNNDYEITYSFSYNNKLPLTKTTTMRQMRGNEAGQVRVGRTEYAY